MSDKTSNFRARKLIIIQSLLLDEFPSGEILYKRLTEQQTSMPSIEFNQVNTKVEMLTLLNSIHQEIIENRGVPILHFVLHGNIDGVGLASGEFMEWSELSSSIMKINVASANNLLITMAVCFGFYSAYIQGITHERSIYMCILGRSDSYSAGDFTLDYIKFYTVLTETSDLGKALVAINNGTKDYSIYHCEPLFRKIIEAAFVKNIKKQLDDYIYKFRMGSKKGGRKLPVPKSKLPDYVHNLMISEVLKWRDNFFMVDLYPENDSRFVSKIEIKKQMEIAYKRSKVSH